MEHGDAVNKKDIDRKCDELALYELYGIAKAAIAWADAKRVYDLGDYPDTLDGPFYEAENDLLEALGMSYNDRYPAVVEQAECDAAKRVKP